ncbi:hypothetical protein HZB08_00930 [Candidatus Saganbacteria bacterium]|uniref:DUF4015 domain-containing protein n=1 Tax=Candidatus Saganbacteria bacterium TaxID=2575572 RepID=A0A9D6YSW3_UNCSA|nr:hypothetical protein [Candidatus Saganbacteria bacterium]
MLRFLIKLFAVLVFAALFIFFNLSKPAPAGKQKQVSGRGLYITSYVARTPSRFNFLREKAKNAGLNTLVIDAKEILSRPFLELARERKLAVEGRAAPSPWLSKLVEELHKENFIVTVRLVVFKDDHLALARPDLAVRVKGGGLYRDRKGGKWMDPYSDEVRLYNALIAESAALSGVDEIQFDYIRFPAEGAAYNAYYPHEKKEVSRVAVICDFLRAVREKTAKYNTSLAVDIFGVTAWQTLPAGRQGKNDIENLGQDLKKMAKYLDVFSPMFYPSHFHAGYDGFANPGSHPYYFVNTGVRKAREILSGEATVLAPWLQGFNLLSPNFGPNYIREQIKAAKDEGVERYLIWNARNDYGTAFRALAAGERK